DLEGLKDFFIKAYGESTVFQSEAFLTYYFQNPWEPSSIFKVNWIGLNNKEEVVSHYGGLQYQMHLGDQLISAIWGVNAYTLPAWRGLGFNGTLVNKLFEENPINATLGMALETHKFYKKLGYNVFDHKRMKRYIFNLSEKTFELVKDMGYQVERAQTLVGLNKEVLEIASADNIIMLKDEHLDRINIVYDQKAVCTTFRDSEFLKWRFLNHPFIDYKVFGFLGNNGLAAYLAIRLEELQPSNSKVARIIDMYGDSDGIQDLLAHVIAWCKKQACLYLDFSKIGDLYSEELLNAGFKELEEEDVVLFPQVSAPVVPRPNHEYLALQSVYHNEYIQKLGIGDIYFTRMDSDRDRIAKVNQINS
ncbi:MAG: GNAT family N-acetyltransferase, partial [Mongoliibacter sp.]|uniref:GNAT family N-acetyltransferase n=1 Tax=Mongoliibacter sp. TaxID=2022438 RepID=UPI0012F0EB29